MRWLPLVLTLACSGGGKDAIDADHDGFTSDLDCDDDDPLVHPGAAERCDGADGDCDGSVDVGAMDAPTWFIDADGDGLGNSSTAVASCRPLRGRVTVEGDCDDEAPLTHPDGVERCGGGDEDCDGAVDEPGADGEQLWYADVDEDGAGAGAPLTACEAPERYVADATDCDDLDPSRAPGRPERCNDVDDDCDERIDEDAELDATTFYADSDGDGYGAGTSLTACSAPAGFVVDASDCDDARADVHPGAPERCEPGSADEDCDGLINGADPDVTELTTWYRDADGDQFGWDDLTLVQCDAPIGYVERAGDCDDLDALRSPVAEERCDADRLDEDCDGVADDLDASTDPSTWSVWLRDDDGDGYGGASSVRTCHPPAGYVQTGGDCEDGDSAISPGADERCDEALTDEDCDGLVDDADPSALGKQRAWTDKDGDGYGDVAIPGGLCELGADASAVDGDCDDDAPAVNPDAAEICTTPFDDDCDGVADADEAIGCLTFYGDGDGDGVGAGERGCRCAPPTLGASDRGDDCDDDDATRAPTLAELCDADRRDEDCDGLINQDDPSLDLQTAAGWLPDADGDGFGDDAAASVQACEPPEGYVADPGDCDDEDPSVHPDALERCDDAATDEDCDGLLDDADPDVDPTTQQTWYLDLDDDGWGAGELGMSCVLPPYAVPEAGDCDDARADVAPGEIERCDDGGVDEDCDLLVNDDDITAIGQLTSWPDADEDGWGDEERPLTACATPTGNVQRGGDCDDALPEVNPEAPGERCATAYDDDCDGELDALDADGCTPWWSDLDGDDYGAALLGCTCEAPASSAVDSGDCDDGDALVNPGAAEVCDPDDVDEDCDGLADLDDTGLTELPVLYADADADGYGDPNAPFPSCDAAPGFVSDNTDCDDDAPSVHPSAPERFGDGTDDDCDGLDQPPPVACVGRQVPTAWPTIAAANAAGPHAVICVAPGTYAEDVELDWGSSLVGAGQGRTVIAGHLSVDVLGGNVIRDLTVLNGVDIDDGQLLHVTARCQTTGYAVRSGEGLIDGVDAACGTTNGTIAISAASYQGAVTVQNSYAHDSGFGIHYGTANSGSVVLLNNTVLNNNVGLNTSTFGSNIAGVTNHYVVRNNLIGESGYAVLHTTTYALRDVFDRGDNVLWSYGAVGDGLSADDLLFDPHLETDRTPPSLRASSPAIGRGGADQPLNDYWGATRDADDPSPGAVNP